MSFFCLLSVQVGGVHLAHGHVDAGGPLRVPHPEGRPLGDLQRQQGGDLTEPAKGPGLLVPVQASVICPEQDEDGLNAYLLSYLHNNIITYFY